MIDRDTLAYWVDAGLTTRELAAMYDVSPETMRRWRARHGLSVVSGPPRRDVCRKGLHDMSVHGREHKRGGRYCVPCRNAYGAAHFQRQQAKKKNGTNQ